MARGVSVRVRDENQGDEGIVEEVIRNDGYNLLQLAQQPWKPKTILDIGGACGAFSKWARYLWPHVRIVSIECSPRSFEMLSENLCDDPKSRAIHAAMYYGVGEVYFYDAVDPPNVTGGGFVSTVNIGETCAGNGKELMWKTFRRTAIIPTVTIDKIAKETGIDYFDLVKIDVEGAELNIFDCATDSELSKLGYIIGEMHDSRGRQPFVDLMARRFPDRLLSYDVPPELNESAPYISQFKLPETSLDGTHFSTA